MRFTRTPIVEAISTLGLAPDDVDLVINCHLHADHAGGNVTSGDADPRPAGRARGGPR